MKRKIAVLLCAAMVSLLFAGCNAGGPKGTAAKKDEGSQKADVSKASQEKQVIKIWHDGDEGIMDVIEKQVNPVLAPDNISVKFEKKSGLTDQIKLYGNDKENGPDLYMYAHDSLGAFVEMGVLSPITDVIDKSAYAHMLPMTLKAGQYKGEQYLLPMYFETLLFMYNKDLWKGEIPSTTEGLYEYMKEHTDKAAGTYALVNQHSTAYNVAPFINGFGGYMINDQGKPGLNDENTKKAIAYNKKFAALESDGDYNTVTTLFNEKKAVAIIGGPWLVPGIKAAGINLGIKSLSDFTLPNGKALAPYSGIQGIGVMKHAAETKKDAIAKVLAALADPKVGIALAEEANCAPANQKAYDTKQVADNEMISAMKRTAQTAQPMPNIPEVSVIWGPAESLLAAVNKSGQDLDSAADLYEKKAETAIADMR